MMNLTPNLPTSGPSLTAGRCFKAKSLDPVFKESVPLSQLNGFVQVRQFATISNALSYSFECIFSHTHTLMTQAEDDSTLSEHERRFKKSLQNLHVPDWFSNSRYYRNQPRDGSGGLSGRGSSGAGAGGSGGKSSSSSSSSTFLTPNTPSFQRPSSSATTTATISSSRNNYLSPGRASATLPANAKPLSTGGNGLSSSSSSAPATGNRPDLTKSKSSDSHDTMPSDWTSKLASSSATAASATSPHLTAASSGSSSIPMSPVSPIYANIKAGSPYAQRRFLSRDLTGMNKSMSSI